MLPQIAADGLCQPLVASHRRHQRGARSNNIRRSSTTTSHCRSYASRPLPSKRSRTDKLADDDPTGKRTLKRLEQQLPSLQEEARERYYRDNPWDRPEVAARLDRLACLASARSTSRERPAPNPRPSPQAQFALTRQHSLSSSSKQRPESLFKAPPATATSVQPTQQDALRSYTAIQPSLEGPTSVIPSFVDEADLTYKNYDRSGPFERHL